MKDENIKTIEFNINYDDILKIALNHYYGVPIKQAVHIIIDNKIDTFKEINDSVHIIKNELIDTMAELKARGTLDKKYTFKYLFNNLKKSNKTIFDDENGNHYTINTEDTNLYIRAQYGYDKVTKIKVSNIKSNIEYRLEYSEDDSDKENIIVWYCITFKDNGSYITNSKFYNYNDSVYKLDPLPLNIEYLLDLI